MLMKILPEENYVIGGGGRHLFIPTFHIGVLYAMPASHLLFITVTIL